MCDDIIAEGPTSTESTPPKTILTGERVDLSSPPSYAGTDSATHTPTAQLAPSVIPANGSGKKRGRPAGATAKKNPTTPKAAGNSPDASPATPPANLAVAPSDKPAASKKPKLPNMKEAEVDWVVTKRLAMQHLFDGTSTNSTTLWQTITFDFKTKFGYERDQVNLNNRWNSEVKAFRSYCQDSSRTPP